MGTLKAVTVDRTAFEVTSLFDESSEKGYWLAQTPYERLRAVELMRQIICGYHPSATRLQRVVEVAQLVLEAFIAEAGVSI
jgi:hypothetical protein